MWYRTHTHTVHIIQLKASWPLFKLVTHQLSLAFDWLDIRNTQEADFALEPLRKDAKSQEKRKDQINFTCKNGLISVQSPKTT